MTKEQQASASMLTLPPDLARQAPFDDRIDDRVAGDDELLAAAALAAAAEIGALVERHRRRTDAQPPEGAAQLLHDRGLAILGERYLDVGMEMEADGEVDRVLADQAILAAQLLAAVG